MLSRHPSLCSLTSALICAVLHTSLESPPAGCTREYASCALRETTLCASRQSSVHHCLPLKAVLSVSRLRDSTNTTSVVIVRGETSRVPALFFSCTAARASPRMQPNSVVRSSAECRETSSFRLRCIDYSVRPPCLSLVVFRLLLNASMLLCHLPQSSRAPSTSEPSRSLTSSMSVARGTHHHVLDLALLHPTAAQLGLLGSTVHAYGVLPGPPR